jgi:hypothetical protein
MLANVYRHADGKYNILMNLIKNIYLLVYVIVSEKCRKILKESIRFEPHSPRL